MLDAIARRLQPGAVVVFDEYCGYPGWQNHEFKAFQEMVKRQGIEYRYLYFSRFRAP